METLKIAGVQPVSLSDWPGKVAAVLFLPGCPMACPYCHNAQLLASDVECVDVNDAVEKLRERRKLLDGIVISGGEPCMQDIFPLIDFLKRDGFAVKLDTNGIYPHRLEEIVNAHLVDYIAMDVKHTARNYKIACGVDGLVEPVRESIRILEASDIEHEYRTTVTPSLHNPEDISCIAHTLIRGAEYYYIQPFVPRDTVPDKTLTEPSDQFLRECRNAAAPHVKHVEIRGRIVM